MPSVYPESRDIRTTTKPFECAWILLFFRVIYFLWIYFRTPFLPLFIFFQLSANYGFIPAKETGFLTSINDKLQRCCRIESIHSIRPVQQPALLGSMLLLVFFQDSSPMAFFVAPSILSVLMPLAWIHYGRISMYVVEGA